LPLNGALVLTSLWGKWFDTPMPRCIAPTRTRTMMVKTRPGQKMFIAPPFGFLSMNLGLMAGGLQSDPAY
jgi:hypothetical protein